MSTFTRRNFLGTLAGGSAMLTTALTDTAFAKQTAATTKIRFFCPRWGANDSWESFCKRVKEAGYDGVEAVVPEDTKGRQEIAAALSKHNLDLIIVSLPGWADAVEHKKKFEALLHDLATLKPQFINSQTGKDFFTFDQNRQIIEAADKVAKETGVKVLHETHRGKFSFAAHVTKAFLEKMPNLRITLDISHWCNVAESLLENQIDAVDLAISRTDHIHARVGHPEGPQVNDPRAPEWENAVKAHLAWWDKVVSTHQQKGAATITFTPEFGPPSYLPTLPFTQQPVADQWGINVHMMQLLKKRYNT